MVYGGSTVGVKLDDISFYVFSKDVASEFRSRLLMNKLS